MIYLVQFLLFFFPWPLRRRILSKIFGFDIDVKSRIGFSFITASIVRLSPCARIGHLNVIRNLDELILCDNAIIGSMNWITGARDIKSSFLDEKDRKSSLRIGQHAAITHQHLIDCTDMIEVGEFSTLAGYRSQFLTHGIDVVLCRQSSAPIIIGSHCLVGSGVIILKGSIVPRGSIVAAGSVVVKEFSGDSLFIAGVPAKVHPERPATGRYFTRDVGRVE